MMTKRDFQPTANDLTRCPAGTEIIRSRLGQRVSGKGGYQGRTCLEGRLAWHLRRSEPATQSPACDSNFQLLTDPSSNSRLHSCLGNRRQNGPHFQQGLKMRRGGLTWQQSHDRLRADHPRLRRVSVKNKMNSTYDRGQQF